MAKTSSEGLPGGRNITMDIDDYRTYSTPTRFLDMFRIFDYYDFYDYENYDYRSINKTQNKSNLGKIYYCTINVQTKSSFLMLKYLNGTVGKNAEFIFNYCIEMLPLLYPTSKNYTLTVRI